jgi:hypothetical protein
LPPELRALTLGGPAAPWEALGLVVGGDGAIGIGGIALRFGTPGTGITGWALSGVDPQAGLTELGDLDGLPTSTTEEPPAEPADHPLGAIAVDHVVALTDDLERTTAALTAAGLDHRRTRDAGDGQRQAFFLVRPTLLELGGPADDHDGAAFWGLTLAVADLDAAAERLGDLLGDVRDAVQPGRRIATVREEAGLGLPVALMTPRD